MDLHRTTARAAPLDHSLYPRTYRIRQGWQIFIYALAMAAIACGMAGVIYYGLMRGNRASVDTTLMIGISFAFVALGIYVFFDTRASKIVLLADMIESQDLRGTRRLIRSQIAGRRRLKGQHGTGYIVLEPKSGFGLTAMKVSTIIEKDPAFDAWFESIQDLDAEEFRRGEALIAADESLGSNPAERMRRLMLARRAGVILNLLAYAAFIWSAAYPHPYMLVIGVLIAFPWAAIALTAWNPRLFSLEGKKGQASVALVLVCIVPACALGNRAIYDVHLLDWRAGLAMALAGSAVLGTVAVIADPSLRQRRSAAISIFFLMLGYGYGTGAELDTLLDHSPFEQFRVAVEGKRVSHGRHMTWYLNLAPWGPRTQSAEFSVPRSLYEALRTGDTVCVGLHPGAIGIAWYAVRRCSAEPQE